MTILLTRRTLFGLLAAGIAAGVVRPANAALGLNSMLGDASDRALDKLSAQDGFYNDLAVRILLPGAKGKLVRSLLKTGDKLGLTTKLTKSLNDAGSLAAKEAKPIFRDAIKGLKLSDVPGIAKQKDGATQYLKSSAGDTLRGKVRPLVVDALGKVGAFNQLDNLSQQKGTLGRIVGLMKLDRESLSDSTTDQALKGIYSYMASEEGQIRSKLGNIGDLIGKVL